MPEKRCCTCKEVKSLDEFSKDRTTKDGLKYQCRRCRSAWHEQSRDKRLAQMAQWRAAHPGYQKEWRRKNPGRAAAIDAAKRHNRRARGGKKISAATVSEIMEASGGVCPYCNLPIGNGHLDHVVALANGGTNVRENLIWVCESCNNEKGTKPLYEFLVQKWATIVSEHNGEIHV